MEQSSSQRKDVLLTPTASEGSQIHVKFRLPKPSTIRQRARGIRDPLKMSLGGNVVLDLSLQRRVVPVGESVDHFLQREGRVSSPCVPVVWVVLAGRRKDST